MRSYEAARNLFSILAFLAWCVIIFGGVLALIGIAIANDSNAFGPGAGAIAAFAGILPGFVLAFIGFIALAIVQSGRASVDTAEYTQQMLQVSRDSLEVSRQALAGKNGPPRSFSSQPGENVTAPSSGYHANSSSLGKSPNSEPPITVDDGSVRIYHGQKIEKVGTKYVVDGVSFLTLGKAKEYINQNAK